MKKGKRIIALAGAILLIVMYLATLVFAFIDHPAAHNLFIGSLVFIAICMFFVIIKSIKEGSKY